MPKSAYKSTFEKPLKSKHREKRRRDKEKKAQKLLKKVDGAHLTHHAVKRANERSVTRQDIKNAIKCGNMKQTSKKGFKINYKNTTIVVSEAQNKQVEMPSKVKESKRVIDVITVYKNS